MKNLYPGVHKIALACLVILLLAGCAGGANPLIRAAVPQAASTEDLPPVKSSSSVIAEGKVVPAEDAMLSFSTSGIVEDVIVSEGNMVQKDQVLIRLKGNDQLAAAVSTAELELLNARQALSDLKSTADLVRSKTEYALAQAKKELDKAEKKKESKEYLRGDQEQIDTARANYILAEDAVDRATELYGRVDDRPEDDPVRAEGFSQLAAARQKRDTALANLNYLLAKPDALDVAEIDARYSVAQSNVADLERQLSLMKAGPDADKLALAEARVNNAEVSVNAAQSRLDDLELKAPFSGTVSAVNINTGEAVIAGAPVVQMADISTWYVETTDLNELNIVRVKIGQPAMVRFDAVPGLDIIGRVTSMKAFGENRQGDVVYTVRLKLEAPDERLRWNMTASVTFLEKGSGE